MKALPPTQGSWTRDSSREASQVSLLCTCPGCAGVPSVRWGLQTLGGSLEGDQGA